MVFLILKDFIESLMSFYGPISFFLQLLLQGVSSLELEQPHPNPTVWACRRLRKWTIPLITLGMWLTVVLRCLIWMDSSYSYLDKKIYVEFLEDVYIYFVIMSFVNIYVFIYECITEEKLENNE